MATTFQLLNASSAWLPALKRFDERCRTAFPGVLSLHYRFDWDSEGEPAIFILAVLEPGFFGEARKLGRRRVEFSDFVRSAIFEEFAKEDQEEYPYPYLRLMTEADFEKSAGQDPEGWRPIRNAES